MLKYKNLILLFLLSLFILGCKKDKGAIFEAALDRLEPELEVADSALEKINLLKKFEKKFKDNPKIENIRARVELLEKEKKAQEAIAREKNNKIPKNLGERIKKGTFDAVLDIALSAIVKRSAATEKEIKKVTIPTATQMKSFEHEANFELYDLRYVFRKEMAPYLPAWKKCNASCQNKRINTLLKPILSGHLFLENGSLNPKTLATLLKKLDRKTYNNTTRKDLVRLYRPSIEKLLKIREAIRKSNDKKVMNIFSELKKEKDAGILIFDWFFEFTQKEIVFNKIPGSKTGIGRNFGFWIRRMEDGTADMIETFLKNLMSSEK